MFFDDIKKRIKDERTLKNCTVRAPSIDNIVCVNCDFFTICPKLVKSKQKKIKKCKVYQSMSDAVLEDCLCCSLNNICDKFNQD